ncbi:MAG: hypothetical protein ACPG19_13355 [Saprospiraceae bacterium]
MKLKQVLEKIDNFNTNEKTEEYEIIAFFDEIGDNFPIIETLGNNEKKLAVETLFNYLNRQSPDLEENWSFIHLIEAIDKPDFKNYDSQLIKINKKNPNLTSLILLNRYTNALSSKAREMEMAINLLKEISENSTIPELVINEAKDYYNYQLEKIK